MRKLTVDRFDGIYATCEDDERKMFAIPTAELPANVREGDKLEIDNDGVITVNAEATAADRADVRAKEDSIFAD
ncbi:MAG: DUF3006 domain-containing protein [Acutalibacteraceae bacterium]